MPKSLHLILLFLMSSLSYAQGTYPTLTEIVTDKAQIFTPSELEELRTKLYQFESETSNQLVILTIDALGNETIEGYAFEVFNKNKLGQEGKDNGILILFSELDREVRIEVGYGLESYITDAVASRIIRNTMIPKFKEEDYYGGLDLATDQIIDFLKHPEALEEFKAEIAEEEEMPWWLLGLISLFLLMFVAAGAFVFYKGYSTLIEILRGIFTGKLAVVRGIFMAIFMSFPMVFGLVFMGMPLFFMAMILGFEEVLLENGLSVGALVLVGLLAFGILTIILVILKIKRKGDEGFKLSLLKSDKTYMKKTFSSSGTHSFGSSSGGRSSSSSFSGGGGSSGGGGASGSW
ncbi:TPM domain-containing protein [Flagellimonas sp.]|uniref:TPM domain-containing protein n=1 Tax=Flagellimonas sp. TaxID=2058762 RepID=UPI003BA970CB